MPKSIVTFEKGIQKDTSKVNQPKGTYLDALNAVITSNDGDMYSLTNERGTVNYDILPSGYKLIGRVNLDKEVILILVNGTNNALGVLKEDNTYEVIFTGIDYGFRIENSVDCQARKLFNGDRMVYFTDNNVPFGFFNLDDILEVGPPSVDNVKIIPDIDVPKVNFIGISEGNGVLKAGVYQFVLRYVTKDLVPTNYSMVTDIIPIVNEGKGISWNKYDGASQDTITGKAINLEFTDIDVDFNFLEVVLIRYEGVTSTFQAFVIDTIPITSSTLSYTATDIPEDSVPITAEELRLILISYDKAKCISQKDNRLFLSNLTESTQNFNKELQGIANSMTTGYDVDQVEHRTSVDGEFKDYKNEQVVHDKRGYRRGEIYSFALAVIFNDGSESLAYHIPGNDKALAFSSTPANEPAVSLADVPTKTLGTYVSGETYFPAQDLTNDPQYIGIGVGFDNGPFLVADGSGVPVVVPADDHVRHHKMPETQQSVHFSNTAGQEFIEILHVNFTFNKSFSQALLDSIQDIRVYRERRNTPQNRSILAQGIGTPIVKTFNRYQDKTHSPKTGDYKGEAIEGSEIYKKAPAFGGMIISNNCYGGTNPANMPVTDGTANAGFIFEKIASSSSDLKSTTQICFHSPETQLAEGAFINEAEIASAEISSEIYINGEINLDFETTTIIENRGFITTRRGMDNFNAMKLYIDFNDYTLNSLGTKSIKFAQKIEHEESVRLDSDDPGIELFPFENRYSTPVMFIDVYNDPITLTTSSFDIELNEAKNNININDTLGEPSKLFNNGTAATAVTGDVYETRLLTIFKDKFLNQYGDISSSEYIPVASVLKEGDTVQDVSSGYLTDPIYGGDTYITKYGVTNKNVWKRVLPMSNGTNSTFYNGATPNEGASSDNGEDYFFDAKSAIDGILTRKGDEFHTLGYFFVESNIHTEFRHEIISEDLTESIPYFPKTSFNNILEEPPENNDSSGYNVQYSFENTARTIFTPTPFTEVITNYENRIIYSDLSAEDDIADSYRIFSQSNIHDLPKNTGGIWNTFIRNNVFYIHTPKSLWMSYVNATSHQTTDLGQVVLGTGGLFNPQTREMFTSEGGYAGTISQFGGIDTPFGYIFPDALQGKVFLLTNTLVEISLSGMSQFFDNNLGTDLTQNYTDNPFDPNSSGITGVWDNELKRAIMTKRGTSLDFTYSWSPVTKAWISSHSYLPNSYVSRDNDVYAFDNSKALVLHQHNLGNYGTYYGDAAQPIRIIIILNEAALHEKSFDNMIIHSTAIGNSGFDNLEMFKQIIANNDYQSSGLIDINTTNDFNPILVADEILGRWKKSSFQIAIPRDKQDNLDTDATQWESASRLKSKYLQVELIYPNTNLENYKLTTNFIEYIFRPIAR